MEKTKETIKIGIIKEGKTPPDTRVVLSPSQCKILMKQYPSLEVIVQPSSTRCFNDQEYIDAGIQLSEDISECKALIGVKEVPINQLIPNKTYFFFSHTIKKQPYNQKLLKAIVDNNIRLIDYECLVNDKNQRIIAFGHWAGVVGAHNALWTWGEKYKQYSLPRAFKINDLEELKRQYKTTEFPPMKIAVTGGGRVSGGAFEILEAAGIKKVDHNEIISSTFNEPVYVQLDCEELYARQSDNDFELNEFYTKPEIYKSIVHPYLPHIDLFINAIYWNPKAPKFWTLEDMQQSDFGIKVIADITCDIAPEASVPSTVKPSTIQNPVYGFDKMNLKETTPFQQETVDVMAIDNLPNELPRDASQNFGEMFLEHVLPELVMPEKSTMLHKATITKNGDLNEPYEYLRDYLEDHSKKDLQTTV